MVGNFYDLNFQGEISDHLWHLFSVVLNFRDSLVSPILQAAVEKIL